MSSESLIVYIYFYFNYQLFSFRFRELKLTAKTIFKTNNGILTLLFFAY